MNELGKYVLARARERKLTLSEMCRRAGISRQTLYAMCVSDAKRLPALETLIAIAVAQDVHPTRLVHLVFDDFPMPRRVEQVHAQRGDRSGFVRDVTYPDREVVRAGTRFTKIWEVQNLGTVPWQNRFLQCVDDEIVVYAKSGERLHVRESLMPVLQRIPVPYTAPGDIVRLSVDFDASAIPSTCFSYWKSVFEDGTLCFPEAVGLSVKVRVVAMAPVTTVLPVSVRERWRDGVQVDKT